ncbi:hypothetical protein CLOP_g15193 [Closterium sp. NIES-67]|nr:hypothetical protein CLOP_g15193 [Closterium sp. NIES-67]
MLQKHVQHWPCVHLQESRLHCRCSPLQRWLSQVNEKCRFVTAGISSHDILAFIVRSDQLQLLWRTIFLRRCRRVVEMPQPHLPCAPHELQPPSAVVRSIEALRFTQANRRFGHHMPLSKSIQETLHLRAARVHG